MNFIITERVWTEHPYFNSNKNMTLSYIDIVANKVHENAKIKSIKVNLLNIIGKISHK